MYLTYIPHDTQRKNKLEEEFFQYLSSREREVIQDLTELKAFKKEISKKYQELCSKHSRCKPLEHQWYLVNTSGDQYLYCGYVKYYLLKSKTK